MTKPELVSKVAAKAGVNKEATTRVVNAFISVISESLLSDTSIQVADLGKFSLSLRKARKGHNPLSGKSIDIPAMRTIKFSPCAPLKRSVKKVGL